MKKKLGSAKHSSAQKAPGSRKKQGGTTYHLKIVLDDFKPPIWRRVIVDGGSTLADLHTIIQAAMGWTDSHLHDFQIGNARYGVPSPDDSVPVIDEKSMRLRQVATEVNTRFTYTYDFGDDWRHTIEVEKITQEEVSPGHPRCIDGKRTCPPEDCGGIHGYEELIEAMSDPKHDRHEELLDWCGEFDPNAFNIEEANAAVMGCAR